MHFLTSSDVSPGNVREVVLKAVEGELLEVKVRRKVFVFEVFISSVSLSSSDSGKRISHVDVRSVDFHVKTSICFYMMEYHDLHKSSLDSQSFVVNRLAVLPVDLTHEEVNKLNRKSLLHHAVIEHLEVEIMELL